MLANETPHVLLVEEDEDTARHIVGTLKAEGFRTEHTATVAEVATAFSAAWGGGAGWDHRPQDQAPHEAGILLLDSSRARARLGWRPAAALNAALAETAEWYRAFHAGADAATLRALTLQQIARHGAPDLELAPPRPPSR